MRRKVEKTATAARNGDIALAPWRERLHEIIFEADTWAGRLFDVALLWAILLSVIVVSLDSVAAMHHRFGFGFLILEWLFTVLFTVEYVLRVLTVRRPLRYVFSFFGAVDLLAVVPTYLSFFLAGSQSLIVIRALRLLRVFRVLKLSQYVGEGKSLMLALQASRRKIILFIGSVLTIVVIMGATMYLVEGPPNGFTSIPKSMYWAIVTMTTVGYGDIAPETTFGQFLAAGLMILGYAVLAVPAGIVTAEIAFSRRGPVSTQACLHCSRDGHDLDARHCKYCGAEL